MIWSQRIPVAALIGATMLLALGCATSLDGGSGPWSQLALRDLEAARTLIREDHPGPVDVHNPDFARWDAEGYQAAAQYARAASSLDGHAAALQRYVGAFRDGHLYVTTTGSKRPARWPGVVIASRSGRFVVDASGDAEEFSGLPALGSELAACDGRSPADILRNDVFPFLRGDERREASWVRLAPRLFDQDNPFRPALHRCTFRNGARSADLDLSWKAIARDELGSKWRDASFGERPRPDLRAFGDDGVWATLSAFNPELVRRAISERTKWQSKQVVVLDLRGNTGGSSIWGYQLLAAFLGKPPPPPQPPPYDEWRVSRGNLAFVETELLPVVRKAYGRDSRVLRELIRLGQGMRIALAQGKTLYRHDVDYGGPEAAADDVAALGEALPAPGAARVFLITDGRCVSACLDFVDQALRYPRVTHVGLATDADSPYSEMRPDIPLPSGLATLSLRMIVYRDRPRTWKPFVPRHVYVGRIADAAGVERWVAALAKGAP